jgi:2-polyprenyl-6-methoxyphenol hydroxylase-like FAD-dependent oxidoreductase
MRVEHTEVLVIGAGPTGLALSVGLHQRGVEHVLIDRLEQGQNTSRAGVIHAQTLESLRELGVATRMNALGLKLSRFTIRDRNRALLSLGFESLPSDFPYLLMIPQNVTEQILAERIVELGGRIRRGVAAERIEHDTGGIRVSVNDGTERYIIAARWLVGGDGMHSTVRRASGIAFEGAPYGESFMLADARLDHAPAPDEVSLFFSPKGLVVVAPMPNGTHRIVATMENAPEHPSASDVQAVLDQRGPTRRPSRVLNVTWSSRFRLHHRLATTYRVGNLLLMGDAAHVHSPAGGQGMNTGLIDAVVLARLLADVVHGIRPIRELVLYDELRRPAAAQVLRLAGRLTSMATARGPAHRFFRNALLAIVDKLPVVKWRIAMDLSGLSRARLAQLPSPSTSGKLPADRNSGAPPFAAAANGTAHN